MEPSTKEEKIKQMKALASELGKEDDTYIVFAISEQVEGNTRSMEVVIQGSPPFLLELAKSLAEQAKKHAIDGLLDNFIDFLKDRKEKKEESGNDKGESK